MLDRRIPIQQLEVTVLLRRGSIGSIGAEFPPVERKYRSREEFALQHGASAEDIEKVRAFASEYGLKVASEDRARRMVKLSGTVQQFSKAFGANLRRCEINSRTDKRRTGDLTIPAELEPVVEGVFGLDNRPQAKAHFRILTTKPDVYAQAAAVSYSPVQVAKAYGFPSGATGAGQCIAIIELGGGFNASDLNSFFGNLGIATPAVTAVPVDGATNSPTGDASGPDGEVELDIEVAGSIAPGAQIAVYFAPNTDQGFMDAVTTAVHDATWKPEWGPLLKALQKGRGVINNGRWLGSILEIDRLLEGGDNKRVMGAVVFAGLHFSEVQRNREVNLFIGAEHGAF